jgi:hypothetical protein
VGATWTELRVLAHCGGDIDSAAQPPSTPQPLLSIPLAFNDAANNQWQRYHIHLDTEAQQGSEAELGLPAQLLPAQLHAHQYHTLLSRVLPVCNQQLEGWRRRQREVSEREEGKCEVLVLELQLLGRQKFAGWLYDGRRASIRVEVEKMTPTTDWPDVQTLVIPPPEPPTPQWPQRARPGPRRVGLPEQVHEG